MIFFDTHLGAAPRLETLARKARVEIFLAAPFEGAKCKTIALN